LTVPMCQSTLCGARPMNRSSNCPRHSPIVGVLLLAAFLVLGPQLVAAPAPTNSSEAVSEKFKALQQALGFVEQTLTKNFNDLIWFGRLENIAETEKLRYTGPPSRVTNNPTAQGAGNDVIITAYTFLPKKFAAAERLPLLVLVHGGVHSDFQP